jgi:hypothetical protein
LATPQSEPPALSDLPSDQDATFEELMAAAEWHPTSPGMFVDTACAAQILGVSPASIVHLADAGRLPWLPTGQTGGGPTRVYRRAQLQVIARARTSPSHFEPHR